MTVLPSSSKPGLLSLPPELIQRILVLLLSPGLSPASLFNSSLSYSSLSHSIKPTTTLTSQNEETFTCLYELPSLQPHLEETVEKIEIDWTSTLQPGILSQIAPNIKSLSISRHRRASSYINALHNAPLRSLSLIGVTVPPFLHTIARSALTLKELSLSFITTTIEIVDGLALEKLELAGISGLSHAPLVSLLSQELRILHLSYLRHSSVNDNTINAIASCTKLTDITLSHLPQCTPEAIAALLTRLPGLYALTLVATRISSHALSTFLQSAKDLRHLSLEEPSWSAAETEFFLRDLSNPLRSFELRDVPGVTDLDIRRLVNRMENLESLSLRRHRLLTVFSAIFISTLRIKKLNLRGVFLSDQALTFLSHLSLHEVSLGGDGQLVPSFLADCVGHISNAGMEKLLKRSPDLKKFFWESPRSHGNNIPVGIDRLDARILAGMLKRYCAKLQRVEVNWLRPRSVNMAARTEAARCDLAFLELEEATGALVLVDERPLY